MKNEGLVSIITVGIQLVGLRIACASSLNIFGRINGYNYNLLAYFLVLVISFVFYMALSAFLSKRTKTINHKFYNIIYYLFYFLSIIFLYNIYLNEVEKMPYGKYLRSSFLREQIWHPLFFVFMSAAIIVLVYVILQYKQTFSKTFRVFCAIFFSMLGAMLSYAPNVFQYETGELWHIHAYINSIINVFFLNPYNDVTSSIYGHYGLIYYPFIKLFGSDLNAIAITIALFTGVTYLSAFYVLNKLISNDFLCLTSMFAVLGTSTTFFGTNHFFQGMPHRCLFPVLTTAFIVWCQNNIVSKKVLYILEYFIGSISIVFNLETGLCCVCIMALYNCFSSWRKSFNYIALSIIKMCALFILCVGSAYVFVNFYNLLMGGEWNSIKTFIYPIGSREYDMFSILRLPLPDSETPYSLYVIIFSLAAFSSISNFVLGNVKQNLNIEKLVIAVSGLTSFVYFINRTAPTNLFISHIQLILLLAVFSEIFVNKSKEIISYDSEKTVKVLASSLSLFLIGWFAIEGIISMGNAISYRAKGVWETKSLKRDIIDYSHWVPKNVVAFGIGIPEIYFSLGLSTGIHITDWSDMNNYSLSELNNILEHNQEVIVNKTSIKRFTIISTMLEKNGFVEKDRFIGKNFICVLYRK